MRTTFKLILIVVLFISCGVEEKKSAQKIIDSAILAHGGKDYDNSQVSFEFRNRKYTRLRKNGHFVFQRTQYDSLGESIIDILSNDGLIRIHGKDTLTLSEKKRNTYSASVNSVIYFALLPYRLNDDAVQKKYLGEETLFNEQYDIVEVSFQKDGGGEDYEDIFVYWFNQKTNRLDYLAYTYEEAHGSGYRFRVAYNQREVNQLVFQDYENYKPANKEELKLHPSSLARLYEAGKLELLSKIELENEKVQIFID